MMKKNLKYLLALLCIIVLLLCTGCSSNNAAPQPISITVWTYYNGTLLDSFNALVKTFNETVGKEKGIVVEAYSQGSVNELEASVMQSAEGKVGAAAMPNIFSAYADTAYALDKLGLVVDVSSYLTADERAAYVDNYLTEGDFGQTGSIKIFPVAKSTELLFLNETDWQPFAEATGTQESEMRTIEGLLAVAERYYNWTDAQTATPDDGKALFGRDAMANYLPLARRSWAAPSSRWMAMGVLRCISTAISSASSGTATTFRSSRAISALPGASAATISRRATCCATSARPPAALSSPPVS